MMPSPWNTASAVAGSCCRGRRSRKRSNGAARDSREPARPVPLDRRELEHVVACPSCRSRMDVHPYYGPGNVVIDSCQGCNQIWLDFGELEQIITAGGRDRGWRVSNR